jgi:hypothetical protein
MKEVRDASIGYPERAYAKWLVLHHMWSRLAPLVRTRSSAELLIEVCEGNLKPLKPLWQANITIFRAALTFYRKKKKRGHGERATDVSSFFKRKGLPLEFERYLKNGGKSFRRSFDRRWAVFEDQLRSMDERHSKPKTSAATAH